MQDGPKQVRLLFVDDEPNIRLTIPLILSRHGFDVTPAATVKDAISAINSSQFEVLLADLNIGEPGDGFTVVSAMRRTQPEAVCLILTGYPAFESALKAIRDQVDGYLVKPANVDELVAAIQGQLTRKIPRTPVQLKRVAAIIEENHEQILSNWLQTTKADPELNAMDVPDEGRLDHFPELLHEIVERSRVVAKIRPKTVKCAREHGELRREQNYTIPLMVRESRIMQECVSTCVQHNLLSVEMSFLISDLIAVSDVIQQLLEASVSAYVAKNA